MLHGNGALQCAVSPLARMWRITLRCVYARPSRNQETRPVPNASQELSLSVPHKIDLALARQRIAARLMAMGMRGTWKDNAYTITDPVKGTLTVLAGEVRVEAQLGTTMSRLRPMIESRLRTELETALRA